MADAAVIFVNTLLGRGVLNGVVNLQFGVYQFDANKDGQIDPAPTTNLRMRMDLACARNLHESLGELLTAIDNAVNEPAPTEKPN